MGTRADFYVGRGERAEWLGSIAWDGYPQGVAAEAPSGLRALVAATEQDYRAAVAEHLTGRGDATTPDQGWPWPWNDSNTTDYAYAFDGDGVYASNFGYPWFRVDLDTANCGDPDDQNASTGLPFPDMCSARRMGVRGDRQRPA